MPSEQLLHVRPVALRHRRQACDGLASPDDREALASVLDGVEEVGKTPRRIGRCDLGHPIRLSDPPWSVVTARCGGPPQTRHILPAYRDRPPRRRCVVMSAKYVPFPGVPAPSAAGATRVGPEWGRVTTRPDIHVLHGIPAAQVEVKPVLADWELGRSNAVYLLRHGAAGAWASRTTSAEAQQCSVHHQENGQRAADVAEALSPPAASRWPSSPSSEAGSSSGRCRRGQHLRWPRLIAPDAGAACVLQGIRAGTDDSGIHPTYPPVTGTPSRHPSGHLAGQVGFEDKE